MKVVSPNSLGYSPGTLIGMTLPIIDNGFGGMLTRVRQLLRLSVRHGLVSVILSSKSLISYCKPSSKIAGKGELTQHVRSAVRTET